MSTQQNTCAELLEDCNASYRATKSAWKAYLVASDEGAHPQLAEAAMSAYNAACRAEGAAYQAYDSTAACHLRVV